MLYVDGNINSLSGPGQGQAAIQDGAAMTITAADNVVVTGDVLYKTPARHHHAKRNRQRHHLSQRRYPDPRK